MKRNLSAFSNFLRAKYAMYTGALRIDSYPYYMNIDPADVCQLRCPTCTTGIENESRRKRASALQMYRPDRTRMTPDLYNALLDEMGEYLFLVNFYNYGEPLLNQHLPTFIEKANRLDIDTIVHSNLSLKLSDERIDALMSCGLDRLTCSVDGFTQPVYEIHRVGGDVELVKRNLARLAKARDRLRSTTQITYKFLVFSHNEHEVDAAQAFAESIGILFERNDAFVYEESWLPSYRKGEMERSRCRGLPTCARRRRQAARFRSPIPTSPRTLISRTAPSPSRSRAIPQRSRVRTCPRARATKPAPPAVVSCPPRPRASSPGRPRAPP
jgi:MoaA/NifB/PqqE/SkfB family radical SAM enzyme